MPLCSLHAATATESYLQISFGYLMDYLQYNVSMETFRAGIQVKQSKWDNKELMYWLSQNCIKYWIFRSVIIVASNAIFPELLLLQKYHSRLSHFMLKEDIHSIKVLLANHWGGADRKGQASLYLDWCFCPWPVLIQIHGGEGHASPWGSFWRSCSERNARLLTFVCLQLLDSLLSL